MTDREIRAGDHDFEARIQQLAERLRSRFRYHSIQLPDGTVLPGLHSIDVLKWWLARFDLPEDLRGKRVLDVGAWDGWFSFECERRGADVVAVDCMRFDTFLEARELMGSKVEYLTLDVNELSSKRLGHFDIVLFLGVLYHLRHPLLGLEKLVELCTDLALIESFVIRSEQQRQIKAVMEFYEHAELGGQIDNWCGPSPECLVSMCRSAGFAHVELTDVTNQRASVVCRRRWPEPTTLPTSAAPLLHAVSNNRTYVPTFHPFKDEYICCYFKSAESELTPNSLLVEVDTFGTHALVVVENGSAEGGLTPYQANRLRPPGLAPGKHEVRIRTSNSNRSNPALFVMLDDFGQMPALSSTAHLPTTAPDLWRTELQVSGDLRYELNRGGSLVCYFRSPAESIAARDVTVDVAGEMALADIISSHGTGMWQANMLLRDPLVGEVSVRLRLGDGEWSTVSVVSATANQ